MKSANSASAQPASSHDFRVTFVARRRDGMNKQRVLEPSGE